jgi:hypothetical protein
MGMSRLLTRRVQETLELEITDVATVLDPYVVDDAAVGSWLELVGSA